MWLINTTTLKLEYFIGPESAPGYAILSHTWGDEEVTFQEFQNLRKARKKKGFAKIAKTCEFAREGWDRLQYAWVDTCCIDKSSSAELSESINSMYDWYRRAKICYVYLSDLPPRLGWRRLRALPYDEDSSSSNYSIVEEGVRAAPRLLRWFTRGWTLQELIASAKTKFYDQNWDYRGDKSDPSVLDELSRITGIARGILEDGSEANLRRTSLGQRMSWASCRHTTRKEDTAYCLLGIFQVNMPLLYGEGDRAFLRLQEEIIKTSTDFSLFAWQQHEEDSREFRGILSCHPKEFAHLRQCIRFQSLLSDVAGEEAVMTNKGLRIHTSGLFVDYDEDNYGDLPPSTRARGLFLGCSISNKLVYISIHSLSGNVFCRVEPTSIATSTEGEKDRLERTKPLTLYLARNITDDESRAIPEVVNTGFRLELCMSKRYHLKVLDVWPPNLFNLVAEEHRVYIRNMDSFAGFLELTVHSEDGTDEVATFLATIYRLSSDESSVSVNLLPADEARNIAEISKYLAETMDPLSAEQELFSHFNSLVDADRECSSQAQIQVTDIASGAVVDVKAFIDEHYTAEGTEQKVLNISIAEREEKPEKPKPRPLKGILKKPLAVRKGEAY